MGRFIYLVLIMGTDIFTWKSYWINFVLILNAASKEQEGLTQETAQFETKAETVFASVFSVEECTQFRPLHIFFYQNVFICQISQEKIPMKQTTQNGKCFWQFSFTCLFVPENSRILFNLWIKIVCAHISCGELHLWNLIKERACTTWN